MTGRIHDLFSQFIAEGSNQSLLPQFPVDARAADLFGFVRRGRRLGFWRYLAQVAFQDLQRDDLRVFAFALRALVQLLANSVRHLNDQRVHASTPLAKIIPRFLLLRFLVVHFCFFTNRSTRVNASSMFAMLAA